MSFYTFLRGLVAFLLFVFNGRAKYHHQDRLPDISENYILVAPHKTWWDPVYLAFATKPKQFGFMAKKELFKNKFIAWWITKCGAFPVDRAHPGPSAIKIPVKLLKETDKSLIMFPTGSRHSSEIKGGVAVIAKMAKVRIVPAVYQGPLTFKGLLSRQQVSLNFGQPIDISDIKKLDELGINTVAGRIDQAFEDLEAELKQSKN